MNMLKKIYSTAAALALGLAAGGAGAAQFDFYKLGRGAGLDFLPTNGVACTGGDLCSGNFPSLLAPDPGLTFAVGSLTATATGSYVTGAPAATVQDHESGWIDPRVGVGVPGTGAGLGVYHVNNDTSDDNITFGETLTITFNQLVTLTGIGLANDGHQINGWASNATFLFNGVETGLPAGAGITGLNLVGTVFTFAYGGRYADQFYLASMTVTPVPEPEVYAMLGIGLGLMGWVGRRRKRHAA